MRSKRPANTENDGLLGEPTDRTAKPEIFYLRVPPRKHTGEGIVLLLALALLFVLLALLVGHPQPPRHAPLVAPAHASSIG